jgi:hypothetical protein
VIEPGMFISHSSSIFIAHFIFFLALLSFAFLFVGMHLTALSIPEKLKSDLRQRYSFENALDCVAELIGRTRDPRFVVDAYFFALCAVAPPRRMQIASFFENLLIAIPTSWLDALMMKKSAAISWYQQYIPPSVASTVAAASIFSSDILLHCVYRSLQEMLN